MRRYLPCRIHDATGVAAKWWAGRENSADLVGGVRLRDKDKLLASVLLDLSRSAQEIRRSRCAENLAGVRKKHELHHREVQKAVLWR